MCTETKLGVTNIASKRRKIRRVVTAHTKETARPQLTFNTSSYVDFFSLN